MRKTILPMLFIMPVLTCTAIMVFSLNTFAQQQDTRPAAIGNVYSMYGTIICSSADDPVHGYYETCDQGSDEHGPVFYAVSSDESGYINDTMDSLIAEHLTEPHTTCDAAQAFLAGCRQKLRFTFSESLYAELKSKYDVAHGRYGSIEMGSKNRKVKARIDTDTMTIIEMIDMTTADINSNYPFVPAKLKEADTPRTGWAADATGLNGGKPDLLLKMNGVDGAVRMKYIPAGTFLQGSYYFRGWRYQDEYPHEVTLTKAFYMMEIPVTQKMWKDYGLTVPTTFPRYGETRDIPAECFGDNKALFGATKPQMDAFIQKLAEENGLTVGTTYSAGGALRLPSDAEWEYAFRVGDSCIDFQDRYQNMRVPAGADVKSGEANGWGLYSMLIDNSYHFVATGKRDNVRVPEIDPAWKFYAGDSKVKGGMHYTTRAPSMHGKGSDNAENDEGTFMCFRLIVYDADAVIPSRGLK